ncbi:MAG: polyphosphate kinase 1 [Phototrophicales bacterium]|nr:polyphosphate kinase 1 [Phototrophicales bacterium]
MAKKKAIEIPAEARLTPDNYINREISTVQFNQRVLALAQDESIPLLERIKFLAIVANNIDEFFMVRVASYLQKLQVGVTVTRPDGLTPAQVMSAIREHITTLMSDMQATRRTLLRDLKKEGIIFLPMAEMGDIEQKALRAYFYEQVYPVLTPLAADHARPFPFISNLSMNLGVYVRREYSEDDLEFVRIKIPEVLPRLVNLGKVMAQYAEPSDFNYQDHFVFVEDLTAYNLDLLFSGMEIVECHPFRVIRNSDIDYENERDSLDISTLIEDSLKERKFGSVVRMTVNRSISEGMLQRLIGELEVDLKRDVYLMEGMLGIANLFELSGINRPDLKYPPYAPKMPESLTLGMNIFDVIRQQDILLHHPYESFLGVEEFFRAAANDPAVIAIKATLYRVGKNSPIVQALMEARENDKQVAVLVELKARFDEENNLEWARAMEHQGVHVTYGVEKLQVKTHAKIALVVRKEGDELRRYVHLGTGNYNSSTARMYSDICIMTADREVGEDATRLFNRLTGYAPDTEYKRLFVAPEYLHPNLSDLIDNEIEAAKAGKPARLIFKMNQLEEDVIIMKLYEASQAGVKINLIVRGMCCLRPGVAGLSENIKVRSILGRYLEHTRIYYFHNAPPDQRMYAGSADMMRRNLYNRVETVFPIMDSRLQRKTLRILATDLRANVLTWELREDKEYYPIIPKKHALLIETQLIFMQEPAGLDVEVPAWDEC